MRLILCLVIFMLIGACDNDYEIEDYLKIESVRSDLVLGLVSYMSFKEVKKTLQYGDDKIIIIDDSNAEKRAGIPPFNIFTVKVPDIQVNSFKGALTLTFFNDRLFEVRFYPNNVSAFLQSIKGLANSESLNIKPYTAVWFKKDYNGVGYVGWIDIRLKQQFHAWIKNYS